MNDDPTLREQIAHARRALARLDLPDAEKHFRAALTRAGEIGIDAPSRTKLSLQHAWTLKTLGRFTESTAIQTVELFAAAGRHGEQSLEASEIRHDIADRLAAEGHLEAARILLVDVQRVAAASGADGLNLRILSRRALGRLEWDADVDRPAASKLLVLAWDELRTVAQGHPLTIALACHPAVAALLGTVPDVRARITAELDQFFDTTRTDRGSAPPGAEARRHAEAIRVFRGGDLRAGEAAIRDAVLGFETLLGPDHRLVAGRLPHLSAALFAVGKDLEADAVWERARLTVASAALDAIARPKPGIKPA